MGKYKTFSVKKNAWEGKTAVSVYGNYADEYKKWMPWIDWNESWAKCIP